MNLTQAIIALRALREKHGGDTEVFADCEKCGHATKVDIVVTKTESTTARLKAEKK